MDFNITTPWKPPSDGAADEPDIGPPPVLSDRVLTNAGLAPDGSIDPSVSDGLISHARDYLAELRNRDAAVSGIAPAFDQGASMTPAPAQANGEPVGPGMTLDQVLSFPGPPPGTPMLPAGGRSLSADDQPEPSAPTNQIGAPAGSGTPVYPRETVLKPIPDPTRISPPVYDESQDPTTPVGEMVVTAHKPTTIIGEPVTSASDAGVQFIRDYERLGPVNKDNTVTYEYPDAVEKPTIGWGHLLPAFGTYPRGISKIQAEATFRDDLQKYSDLVKARVKVPLTQNQFDAVTSLAYNAPAALNPKSGFLTTLNNGDYVGAAAIIPQYNKARVRASDPLKPLRGLTIRRGEEQDMFLNGTYNSKH